MTSTPLRSHPCYKSENISLCPNTLEDSRQPSRLPGLCVARTSSPRLTQLRSHGSRRCLFWFWHVSSPVQWGALKALSWSTVLQGTIRGSINSSSFMMRIKDPCTGSFHLHSLIPILALEGLIFTSVSRQMNELNLIFKVYALKPIIFQLTM